MDGWIHSTESFGTVDGPGLRYVVFLQGCPMRCAYCHNPDTWEAGKGTRMSADEIIRQFERNRSFYSHGGITVSGGEPLLQLDFLIELFRLARSRHIHTCLDTSGITYRREACAQRDKLDQLMTYTDLVMLDIKHIDDQAHRKLTGHSNEPVLAFAGYLENKRIPVWIRHVVVPGVTDDESALRRLGRFIGRLSNVKALDILPYHTMGTKKYRELGIPYPLEGVEALPKEKAILAKQIVLSGMMEARREAASHTECECKAEA
ncbi:MAG: pyruvate formate lyase-activating protein [Clostridia bacterium]|nr:pyruvate formate lyase-activating protein [Clostridia bacterium]